MAKPLPLVTASSLREVVTLLGNAVNHARRSGHDDLAIGLAETRDWLRETAVTIRQEHLRSAAEERETAERDRLAQAELDAATERKGGVRRDDLGPS